MNIVDVLDQTDLFQGLPDPLLTELAARGVRHTFPAGAQLVCEGEAVPTCLHVILRGQVRIERSLPDEDWPVVLAACGPGTVVGELRLLDGRRRHDAIVAVEETETLELGGAALVEIMLRFPDAGRSLLPLLSQQLSSLEALAAAYSSAA